MEENLSLQQKNDLPIARADRLIALLFALSIPLHGLHSSIAWITIGEILLLVTCLLALWRVHWKRFQLYRSQAAMVVLYMLFAALTIMVMISRNEYRASYIFIRLVRWGFYVFAAVLLAAVAEIREIRKFVIALSVIASVILLIQFIAYTFFQRILVLHLGSAVLGAAREGVYRNGVLQGRIWRFSAFFSEPAHFSYYCNLGLAMLVFYRSELRFDRAEILMIVLIVLAILLCSSTYGIALLGLQAVWFLWRYLFFKGKNPLYLLLLIMLIALVIVVFSKTQLAEYLFYKIRTITQRERFQFAWKFLHEQRPNERLFGIGVGNEEHYFHISGYRGNVYLNSVSLTYLYCGWIGIALAALYFLFEIFLDSNGKPVLMMMFLLISICSTAFYSPTMIMITVTSALLCNVASWTDRRQIGVAL